MFLKRLCLTVFSAFLFVLAHPFAVSAQDNQAAVDNFSKPMPEIPPYNPETFAEITTSYKKRPYEDDALAYRISIPKDWTLAEERGSSNFQVSDRLFIELNKYYGPASLAGRSRLEISAVNMDYDFTAEQWYLKYILESGYTVEGIKVHDDRKVESLMVIMEGDFSYYLRTVAQINDNKMILAQYYLPAENWFSEAPLQASVLETFEILNEKKIDIGQFKKFQFLDVAEVEFPDTWRVISAPMRSVERLDAKFINIRGGAQDALSSTNMNNSKLNSISEGYVDVSVVLASSSPSLISEIQNYKKNLEASGIVVGKKVEMDHRVKFSRDINFSITEIYEAVDSANDTLSYELWFSVFVAGNYYYFATLVTPSKGQNYIAWARNTRGYQRMMSKMTPASGAYLDR